MTIIVSANLINSFGEVLDSRKSVYESLEMAVLYANTCKLSGEPDCVMDTHFTLHDEYGKVAYKGNWDFLKQLYEIENKKREDFKKAHGDDFSEEDLMTFLYTVETWLINRIDVDDDNSEIPIGYFEGTHRDVMDYVHKRNDEDSKDRVLYEYEFLDKLN